MLSTLLPKFTTHEFHSLYTSLGFSTFLTGFICLGTGLLQRFAATGDQGRRPDLRPQRAQSDQRANRRRPRLWHGQDRRQSVSETLRVDLLLLACDTCARKAMDHISI